MPSLQGSIVMVLAVVFCCANLAGLHAVRMESVQKQNNTNYADDVGHFFSSTCRVGLAVGWLVGSQPTNRQPFPLEVGW